MNYDVDYFIKKFSLLSDIEVGTSQDTGCAYGQCSAPKYACNGDTTEEGKALEAVLSFLPDLKATKIALYKPYCGTPARINNGEVLQYQQPTPRKRVLAALFDVKKIVDVNTKVVTKYVAVSEVIRNEVPTTLEEVN